jgi:Squalene-hopene cyclase C-terminal domain/Prenyltransferase and squalene oxidase repeat
MNRVPERHPRRHGRMTAAAALFLVTAVGVSLWSATVPASAVPSAAPSASPAASTNGTVAATTAVPATARIPDLGKGVAYLVAPARLTDGHYYQPFGGGFADFGLTIDGAFALAATGGDDTALKKIVDFLDQQGQDGSDRTVNDWTGIGTPYASGGSIGKEALLAEVVGDDPHAFGGHDLIAALDAAVCARASSGSDTSCAAPGEYTYSPSVFSQALGVMAQLRAGDTANAAAPISYLEGLQNADGAWPSLIPSTGDSDVDSTAMAVMALALVPGDAASQAVDKGVAWIAAQQEKDGGFPGAAGDSTNSAALAVQAMCIDAHPYAPRITKALAFLAGQQGSDGGFDVAAGGQPGSDLRATTQVVGGATGTSFGTLARDLNAAPTPSDTPTTYSATPSAPSSVTATPSISTVPDSPGASATAVAPVVPGGGNGGQLAATGTDARQEGLLAAGTLAAGAILLAGARRRRPVPGRHR